jgi:hypothetical protein
MDGHLEGFRRRGWTRIRAAVPIELCRRLVEVLERELAVPVHDAAGWDAYGGEGRSLVPIWGHQAQWDIRQHPRLHRLWAVLTGTERLWVSLDSCRFTPPWKPGHAEPYGIHWDHDPWDPAKGFIQGVLALTDTAADQGGFRCVPALYRDRAAWPNAPLREDGKASWLADTTGRAIVHVAARAGDLIVWDSRVPHGNSRNRASKPRIAFYLLMHPAKPGSLNEAAIDSWRSGRCVPWWRDRRGYDRVEPWPPAALTPLGRRLLGLDPW